MEPQKGKLIKVLVDLTKAEKNLFKLIDGNFFETHYNIESREIYLNSSQVTELFVNFLERSLCEIVAKKNKNLGIPEKDVKNVSYMADTYKIMVFLREGMEKAFDSSSVILKAITEDARDAVEQPKGNC